MKVGDLVTCLDEDIGIITKIETARMASVYVEWTKDKPCWHEPDFLEVLNADR